MIRAVIFCFMTFMGVRSAFAEPPARPCPYMTIGWSQQYNSGPITSVSYATDFKTLYVIFEYTKASAFSNVPISITQAFSQTKNPIQIYNSSVVRSYHPILLADQTNCPLLAEVSGPCYLLADNLVRLLSNKDVFLLNDQTACPVEPNPYQPEWNY